MRSADRRTLESLKERLLAADVPLLELWAFGSRVRGDFDHESDIDVLLVLRERTKDAEDRIDEIAWEVGAEAGYVVSTILRTGEQLAAPPYRASALLEDIHREGLKI